MTQKIHHYWLIFSVFGFLVFSGFWAFLLRGVLCCLCFHVVVFFFSPVSIVINSLWEERAGLCFSCIVCLFYRRRFLSFFSSSWCQGLTAACDCGTPWTFLLTLFQPSLYTWAASWQNQQNGMCAERRLRSALTSAQSDQRLRCPHEES